MSLCVQYRTPKLSGGRTREVAIQPHRTFRKVWTTAHFPASIGENRLFRGQITSRIFNFKIHTFTWSTSDVSGLMDAISKFHKLGTLDPHKRPTTLPLFHYALTVCFCSGSKVTCSSMFFNAADTNAWYITPIRPSNNVCAGCNRYPCYAQS